jgi:hypothetical protein
MTRRARDLRLSHRPLPLPGCTRDRAYSTDVTNHDSAFTHTEQHGLINVNASPAINAPIHDNHLSIVDLF